MTRLTEVFVLLFVMLAGPSFSLRTDGECPTYRPCVVPKKPVPKVKPLLGHVTIIVFSEIASCVKSYFEFIFSILGLNTTVVQIPRPCKRSLLNTSSRSQDCLLEREVWQVRK